MDNLVNRYDIDTIIDKMRSNVKYSHSMSLNDLLEFQEEFKKILGVNCILTIFSRNVIVMYIDFSISKTEVFQYEIMFLHDGELYDIEKIKSKVTDLKIQDQENWKPIKE